MSASTITITIQPKNQSSTTPAVAYDLSNYAALVTLNGRKLWLMVTPEGGLVAQAYDYKTELAIVPTDQGRVLLRLSGGDAA